MANDYGVRDEKARELDARWSALGLDERGAVIERFVRSSGPGGQNVNKNSTAVYLKHVETGTEVKAQHSRSQALNRFYARRSLCEKLEALSGGEPTKEQKKIERLKKQKQRRRRRSKKKHDDSPKE